VRRRLLIALLSFAAVAVTGFAWPLLTSTAAERTQRLLIDRGSALDRFAVLAQQSFTAGGPTGATDGGPTGASGGGPTGAAGGGPNGAGGGGPTALADEATAYAELYGEGVLILDRRRRPIVAAGDIDPDDPGLRPLIDGALRNEPGQRLPQLRPWSAGHVVLTRPIGTDTQISGVVAVRVSVAAAAADVARGWTLILLGALAAAVGFVLLAMLLARWVLRPLARLERGLLAVTAGRQGTHVSGGGGPPELRALAASFNRMSDAVVAAADKERQLIADASHQLRNPMTALRLRVDSLAPEVAEQAQPGYRSLAAEVERLESLLDGLLALAAADEVAAHPESGDLAWCWPDVVVQGRLAAWRPSAREAGVRLVDNADLANAPEPADAADQADTADPAGQGVVGMAACSESELAQVLDVLLDNAIRYSGVGSTVRVHAESAANRVRLVVEDSGPGLPAADRARATQRFWRAAKDSNGGGTGLGLAIAERLVTARAGTLRLLPAQPAGLAVHVELPRHPVAGINGEPGR